MTMLNQAMTSADLHRAVERFSTGSPERAEVLLELVRLVAAAEKADLSKLPNLRDATHNAREVLTRILGASS